MQGSRILMAEPHDASLLWQVGSEIRLVGSHLQHAVHILCSHADCRHIAKAWLPMVSPALLYICRLHIFFIWSNGHIYICTSNEPEVVDLVKNLICGDESRQAARTLYADLINDHEIRHPNHYCGSILLSLLDVMVIIEFTSPLISWQHRMCRLHCTCTNIWRPSAFWGNQSKWAVTDEYNGSFMLLRKHGIPYVSKQSKDQV
jgi:hypothetical protein